MTGSMSDIWRRKKIWRKAIVCLFIFYGNVILSQGNFSTLDQGYFRSPVGHTFYLSGNFGDGESVIVLVSPPNFSLRLNLIGVNS